MKQEEHSGIKRKILVVDDSEMNRSLLCDMLSGNYEILEAENVLEASVILQSREQEIAFLIPLPVTRHALLDHFLGLLNRYRKIHQKLLPSFPSTLRRFPMCIPASRPPQLVPTARQAAIANVRKANINFFFMILPPS